VNNRQYQMILACEEIVAITERMCATALAECQYWARLESSLSKGRRILATHRRGEWRERLVVSKRLFDDAVLCMVHTVLQIFQGMYSDDIGALKQ